MFNLGVVKDESMQPKTSSLHLWLMAYEFSETIMIVTKSKVAFLTSRRKKTLLEQMEKPADYKGPALEVILREPNAEKLNDNFDQLLKSAFGDLDKVKGPIGVFSNEQPQGNFVTSFKKRFDIKLGKVALKDCSKLFQEVTSVKTAEEISSLRIGAKI